MTTDTPLRPLLTARDVSAILGISMKTVRRWEREGKLPAVRLSSQVVRFPADRIEALMQPLGATD